MRRPKTFNDIKGHEWIRSYLQENLSRGTLHHFLILEGREGLGKTAIADLIALSLVYGINESPEKEAAYEDVVVNNRSNDYIKRFACSVDGGKEAAKQIKDEMSSTFAITRPKVIICDECHGLTEAAQDVFLSDTEFIDKNVYIIMMTTEYSKLKMSLKSRAVSIHMSPLKLSEMLEVLREEVRERNLHLQDEDAMLRLIAEWAECKPRTGLNILNAFGSDANVSSEAIRSLIGYMNVSDVLPLLGALGGSMTFGLSYIQEMQITQNIVDLTVECLAIKSGQGSYKVRMSEVKEIRNTLESVSVESLTKFLYGITRHYPMTRTDLIHAFIGAQQSGSKLFKAPDEHILFDEQVQRASHVIEVENTVKSKAPTLDSLLSGADIVSR